MNVKILDGEIRNWFYMFWSLLCNIFLSNWTHLLLRISTTSMQFLWCYFSVKLYKKKPNFLDLIFALEKQTKDKW